jgi:hypothetical protein
MLYNKHQTIFGYCNDNVKKIITQEYLHSTPDKVDSEVCTLLYKYLNNNNICAS